MTMIKTATRKAVRRSKQLFFVTLALTMLVCVAFGFTVAVIVL